MVQYSKETVSFFLVRKFLDYQCLGLFMVLKAAVIKEIKRLREEEHLSIRKIGMKLDISPGSVARHINSRKGTGVSSSETASSTIKDFNVQSKEEQSHEERIDDFLDQMLMKDLKFYKQLLRIKKLREALEEKRKEDYKKSEPEKIPLDVDGTVLHVTFQEFLAWKQYESEQKDRRLESELREERKDWRLESELREESRKVDSQRKKAEQKQYWINATICCLMNNNPQSQMLAMWYYSMYLRECS